MLEGWKTYILAGSVLLTALLHKFGAIDADTSQTIVAILLGGGLATLRMGVKSDVKSITERREV